MKSIKKKLNIGVIGAGGRGDLSYHAHKPEEGVRLIAGADIDDSALKYFKEKFGPDAFVTKDYKELLTLDEIDAVFITTPDFLHEEHAVAALKAGKHVYLEKPMAITIKGCDRILKTAYKHKKKLYLGHNMRHMSFLHKLREIIDSGMIGDIKAAWCRHFISYGGDSYFKDWHAEREKSMGMLLQKGTHDIDNLHWLCKGYTKRVTAFGGLTLYNQITDRHAPEEKGDASWKLENWPPLSQKGLNPVIDIEDISMVLMELDNGVYASYQQCHFTPDAWRNYVFIGTEGRVENFGDEPGDCVIKVWNKRTNYNAEGDIEYPIAPASGGHGGADLKIVSEFIRYIREGGKILTSPVAARYSAATGYMATESLRSGGTPKNIPPLDKKIAEYFNADVQ